MPLPVSLLLAAQLIPMAAFFLLVAAGRRMGTTLCGTVGTVSTLSAFALSLVAMMHWLNGGVWSGEPWGAGQGPASLTVRWSAGIPVGLYVDSLTLVVVTGGLLVSAAVHVFTTGYLRNDIRGPRIFALMAVADAAVVGLMTSPSLPQWAAWTIVGSVATYLVALPVPLGPGGLGITPVPRGLTVDDLSMRATASLAMFLCRTLGDVFLILGCAVLLSRSVVSAGPEPSLGFAALWLQSASAGIPAATPWLLVAAAAMYGCVLPASLFLPDAKGSPTPAAGLAYAVTMLPVGPLLLIRVFPMLGEGQLLCLAIIGGATLVTSAVFAVFESDLRRLLAWVAAGTAGISMAAIGAGSPGGCALHLIASMFALSVLLLAAGGVLHACLGERRLWHYGGLLFRMPASALLLAHGAGTLLGGPLLAGSSSWSTLFGHAYRSVQSGEARGVIALAAFSVGLVGLAVALGRGWAMLLLDVPRDRVVYAAARESATLTVPVAILALIATVAGSAVLSPVRQLVAVLPEEVVVGASRAAESSAEEMRSADLSLSRWRTVQAPRLTPPPLPPDEQDLPGERGLRVEVGGGRDGGGLPPDEPVVPPDDRQPRAIDPIRWLLASLGAAGGLLLAGRGRGSFEARRREQMLARGFFLSSAAVRVSSFVGQSVAALILACERLLIGPILDLLARVLLPFGRLPTASPAATRTGEQAHPRAALLAMAGFATLLMLALAAWGVSYVSKSELQRVLP